MVLLSLADPSIRADRRGIRIDRYRALYRVSNPFPALPGLLVCWQPGSLFLGGRKDALVDDPYNYAYDAIGGYWPGACCRNMHQLCEGSLCRPGLAKDASESEREQYTSTGVSPGPSEGRCIREQCFLPGCNICGAAVTANHT